MSEDCHESRNQMRGPLADRPATCTVGATYFATDVDKLYVCSAENTWTAQAADDGECPHCWLMKGHDGECQPSVAPAREAPREKCGKTHIEHRVFFVCHRPKDHDGVHEGSDKDGTGKTMLWQTDPCNCPECVPRPAEPQAGAQVPSQDGPLVCKWCGKLREERDKALGVLREVRQGAIDRWSIAKTVTVIDAALAQLETSTGV